MLVKRPLLILVAGGSASGKSTVVQEILEKAGLDEVLIIKHDDYYLDQSNLPLEVRYLTNYDHPSSLDNELLYRHLNELLSCRGVDKPTYDFVNHTRSLKVEHVVPKPIIIVEGILILENEKIRELSNMNLFVELDDDTRFIRRMLRDMRERGRSLESIITQYESTVKPMFHKHIKPTKRYADVIIPNDRKHDIAVDLIVTKIKQIIGE
ncbi:MAG: uridine kinase [Tenericutes bacterium GWC2_34_14]|nr:MAG: uridine kinase [Tenericutes bacterium GWA2_35_7]OHE29260.1 MAG: uridine kinase [Tenericutes bacterium GWC2_34_14]OHE34343.1 MAG: uridine kinase [Tenericutes bacterium GWE2_34_108]OHE35695.1 MAG: uridine kinase [Tenericutes bacterium GWF1_35_14]OHE38910.1 MAG: uridine kinase [Tenericutes bacterium GWF2_35_184]OHE41698.1 MAG: uridine kinase [Tenericutes bacterium RIFOXYA12_FULL_35_10]OHE43942.1 MAG: uridine kinase [Tenericutes bacterium RIFOXYA2_FULL_36_32]OHE46381.1 MAG: uridine kinas